MLLFILIQTLETQASCLAVGVEHSSRKVKLHLHVWSTHINHVPPALCLPAEQGFIVRQPSIVYAHVHALVQRLDRREHGQDLLLVGKVALVGDQCAAVACTLTLC